MCLIAYSPDGAPIPNKALRSAYAINHDGIGVMSQLGVRRFTGRGALRKARRYLRAEVLGRAFPFAIHFRYATHGAVSPENTHPFAIPNGGGYVMHNGVISWCGHHPTKSDTRVFVDQLDDYPGFHDPRTIQDLGYVIGLGSKLCIMNADGTFSLVNEKEGDWIGGAWYSNTYSLPRSMEPAYSGQSESQRWLRRLAVEWDMAEDANDPYEDIADEDSDLFLDVLDDADDDHAAVLAANDGWALDNAVYSPMQRSEEIHDMRAYYRSLEKSARAVH